MKKSTIPYSTTGILNNLIEDYVNQSSNVQEFHYYPYEFNAFEQVIEHKEKTYQNRSILHTAVKQQYESIEKTEAVQSNINLLANENCFTVTTAHQSNIFTGPLYSIYKAASCINICRSLKEQYPDKDFVPVFWQGSEDHDYEEVNHTYLYGKKIEWQAEHRGEAVGRMPSKGFESAIEKVADILGDRPFTTELIELLNTAYNGNNTISFAYKTVMNHLMGKYGLIILDQDSKVLKSGFIEVFKAEIQGQIVTQNVIPTIEKLESKAYKVQAQPREINLFYIDENNVRNRIVKDGDRFKVLNTLIEWINEGEILAEVEKHPENFSPNVFLRPVYQEKLLPNLAYVGGQGELSYWLELKALFNACSTPYPMLVLRNMLAIVNSSTCKKIAKLELSQEELFLDEAEIIKRFVKDQTDNNLELTEEKKQFEVLYSKVKEKAASIDPTLEASVESVLQGQLKALESIEQKILRAEKRNFETAQNQISSIKNALFPDGGLQERSENFMHFYSLTGPQFIEYLIENLQPFDKAFYLLKDA